MTRNQMYINYFVDGYTVEFQAGPYDVDIVDEHWRDIRGYDRVRECFIAFDRDPRRILINAASHSLNDRDVAEADLTVTH